MVDPLEVEAVKQALAVNANNIGVGIVHEPTGRIHLRPFDDVPGGHAQLAGGLNWPLAEVRGFIVGLTPQGHQVVNLSHLNNQGQGSPGPMQMPQPLFDTVRRQLAQAGL